MLEEMPRGVAATVGDVLGGYYYHHQTINSLFYEAGALTLVPEGSCRQKISDWLIEEGKRDPAGAFVILGRVIEEFMDSDVNRYAIDADSGRKRIKDQLERHGLSYTVGGKIVGASIKAPSRALAEALADWSLKDLDADFSRALLNVDTDPPAAVTAASAILESLFKVYISEQQLDLPSKQSIQPLWKVVAKDLNLTPEHVDSDDLRKVLSGLTSIVDGVGSFRTHQGSAHGHAGKRYRPAPRHARLVVHSAHTLAHFILETWAARIEKDQQK